MLAANTKMFWLAGAPLFCMIVKSEPPALAVYDPASDRESPIKAKAPKATVLGPAFSVSVFGLLANCVTVPVPLMMAFDPIMVPAALLAMFQFA